MSKFDNPYSHGESAHQERLSDIIKSLNNLYQDLECSQNGQTLTVEDIDREHRANRFPYGSTTISRAFGGNFVDSLRAAGIPTISQLKEKKEEAIEKKITKEVILEWFENFFLSTGFVPRMPDVSEAIKKGILPPGPKIKKICGISTVELIKTTEAKIQLNKFKKNQIK
jgi:hypothetical protein